MKSRCAFEWTLEVDWRWASLWGVEGAEETWSLGDLMLAVGRYDIYRARTIKLKEGRRMDRRAAESHHKGAAGDLSPART